MRKYEGEFDARLRESSACSTEVAMTSADRPHEIWITPEGALSSGDNGNTLFQKAAHLIGNLPPDEVFLCCVFSLNLNA